MFTKVEIWTVGRTENGMAVLLRLPSSAQCVPVYVEPHEAQAVLAALSDVRRTPPQFGEFFHSYASAVGVRPETMEILKGEVPGEYRAMIHFSGDGRRFSLSTDAPVAIAIAVRGNIPIFLDNEISEEDGIGVAMAESEMPFATQLTRLQGELDRRVKEEDYERAASIRDRIRQIEDRMRTDRE